MTSAISSTRLVVTVLLLVSCIKLAEVNADGGYGGYGTWPTRNPLIDQLRSHIQGLEINPWWTSDRNLERMLIDTGYRVDRAAKRLRRTASFRARNNADHLLDWTPSEHFTHNLPYECTGYSKDGSPVIYFPFGQWNTPRLFRLATKREFYLYFLRMLEDARSRTEGRKNPKTGEKVDQAVVIFDAKGYGLKKVLTIRATWTLMRLAYAIDRHYPFLVQKWYVVNAPKLFHVLWKFIRFASSPTLERAVEIYSRFTTRGADALAYNIPKDAIPVSLGGTYIPEFEQKSASAHPLAAIADAWSSAITAWPSKSFSSWPDERPEEDEKCVDCTSTASNYGPPQVSVKTTGSYGAPVAKTPSQFVPLPGKAPAHYVQYDVSSAETSSQYVPPPVKSQVPHDSSPDKGSTQYGPPPAKQSTQYDAPPVNEPNQHDPAPAKQSTQYGPPPPAKQSTQYGPPPAKGSIQYGPPTAKESIQYGPPPTKASTQYGPPLVKQSTQYGSPSPAKESTQYGLPPVKQSTQYGSPSPAKESTQYGLPPAKQSTQYGLPPAKQSTQYGPPTAKQSTQYAPPTQKLPAELYSPPTKSETEYESASTKAGTQYSPSAAKPAAQYGPPPAEASTSRSLYGPPMATTPSRYASLPAKTQSQNNSYPAKHSSQYGPPPAKTHAQYNSQPAKKPANYESPPAKTSTQYSPPSKEPTSYDLLPAAKTPAQYGPPSSNLQDSQTVAKHTGYSVPILKPAEIRQPTEFRRSDSSPIPSPKYNPAVNNVPTPEAQYADLPSVKPPPHTVTAPWGFINYF